MQDVQMLEFYHFDNLAGERRRVQRKIKEGVGGNFDLVIDDITDEPVEPDRHCIAYEMYLVAAFCQSLAELCRHDPAPSICRVTRDADFHLFSDEVNQKLVQLQLYLRDWGFL